MQHHNRTLNIKNPFWRSLMSWWQIWVTISKDKPKIITRSWNANDINWPKTFNNKNWKNFFIRVKSFITEVYGHFLSTWQWNILKRWASHPVSCLLKKAHLIYCQRTDLLSFQNSPRWKKKTKQEKVKLVVVSLMLQCPHFLVFMYSKSCLFLSRYDIRGRCEFLEQ